MRLSCTRPALLRSSPALLRSINSLDKRHRTVVWCGFRFSSTKDSGFSKPKDSGLDRKTKFGNQTKLGNQPKFSDQKKLDDQPKFSDQTKLGDQPKFSDQKKLGDQPKFSDQKKLGDQPKFSDQKKLGDQPKLSDQKKLGDQPKFSDLKKLGEQTKMLNNESWKIDRLPTPSPDEGGKTEEDGGTVETTLFPKVHDVVPDNHLKGGNVYIAVSARKGRSLQPVTNIIGLPFDKTGAKVVMKNIKTKLGCGGSITNDERLGIVLELYGNHQAAAKKLLQTLPELEGKEIAVRLR